MTKETKLGLAAIGVLLASFAGVLYMRLSGSGDPISPIAVESANSKKAAAKNAGSDARSNLGTSGGSTAAKPAASGPFASRGSGRSDPFGSIATRSSKNRLPADGAEDELPGTTSGRRGRSIAPANPVDSNEQGEAADLVDENETEAPDVGRYAHGYRAHDESAEEASADEEFADEDVDQEIPDADDGYSDHHQESIEAETAWDEEPATDRYRSRLTDADADFDADAAETDGDGTTAEFNSEPIAETGPPHEEFDPTGEVDDEPALIEEQESLQPLVADDEGSDDADSADTSSTWRMRESGASCAAFESDRPSRRPISSQHSSIAVESEQPDETVAGNDDFAEDDSTDVLTPEPMSLHEDRYAPPPRSNHIPVDGEAIATETITTDNVSADGSYVVMEGESLFDIAHRQLGSAARWAEIYDLNRDALGTELEHPPAGLRLALPDSAPPPERRALRPTSRRR